MRETKVPIAAGHVAQSEADENRGKAPGKGGAESERNWDHRMSSGGSSDETCC